MLIGHRKEVGIIVMIGTKIRERVKKMRYYAFSPNLLIRLRKSRRMTQVQLADASGLSQAAISNYEKGEREPDTEALKKLGKAFSVYFVADWNGLHSEDTDPLEPQ